MNYQKKKERARLDSRAAARDAQEIGPLPPVLNPRRRNRAAKSFKAFCESYFSELFFLKWSKIHLDVIAKIERVINNGEIYALAMPRGSGKTTLFQVAVLWAALTGRAELVVLIAANARRANSLLDDLKVWLETNEILAEDFPEVCLPIQALERVALRARGQTLNGEPTRIGWRAAELVLPTVEGSPASGACIKAAGTKGSDLRGLTHTKADGRKVRPSLALVDDPQTRETAQSVTQCDNLEKILKADVLGMAGPGKKLACCVATTVVASNDVAQRLLDRTKNPEFRGERYQLLDSFPKRLDLWDEYRRLREASLQSDGDGAQATAFYRKNRKAMDEGAISSWSARYNDDEISAIQNAMNLYFRDANAFLSEYQNEPPETETELDALDEVVFNKRDRGFIPSDAEFLTCFIDVHKNLLFYVLCAWSDDFEGTVVDYGTYPDQPRARFTLADASPTLLDASKTGLEGAIYAGLSNLTTKLFAKEYEREDGVSISISKGAIDAGWGAMTDVVYKFIRDARLPLYPSHGRYVGAAGKPFGEYAKKRGDKIGPHWRIPNDGTRGLRRLLIDTNYWKSFVYARLTTAPGDQGRLAVNGSPRSNLVFLEHLTAEKRTTVEAKGRRVDEWSALPNRDNHWFDCLVGATVCASIAGAKLPVVASADSERKKVSFKELQERARAKKK